MVQYGIVRRGFSPASERLSDNSQRNTGVFNDLPVTVQGISGQPLTGRKPDNSIPSLLLSDPAVSLLPAGFLFSLQISLLPSGFSFRVIEVISVNMRVRWWGAREAGALHWLPRAFCMPWHTRPNKSRRKVALRAAFCGFAYAGTYVIWHYGPTAERNTHRPARNVCRDIHKPTFRRQNRTGRQQPGTQRMSGHTQTDISAPDRTRRHPPSAQRMLGHTQTVYAKSPACVTSL